MNINKLRVTFFFQNSLHFRYTAFFRYKSIFLVFFITIAYMSINVNKAGQTHDQLQAACWAWACKTYYPLVYRHLIAVPNDASGGNVVRAKRYQALGVTSGVWDMVFNWFEAVMPNIDGVPYEYQTPVIIPAVFWWEFKVGTDTLKPKQKNFRATMLPLGHTFFVASEEEEFQTQFKSVIEPTLDHAKQIMKGVNIL